MHHQQCKALSLSSFFFFFVLFLDLLFVLFFSFFFSFLLLFILFFFFLLLFFILLLFILSSPLISNDPTASLLFLPRYLVSGESELESLSKRSLADVQRQSLTSKCAIEPSSFCSDFSLSLYFSSCKMNRVTLTFLSLPLMSLSYYFLVFCRMWRKKEKNILLVTCCFCLWRACKSAFPSHWLCVCCVCVCVCVCCKLNSELTGGKISLLSCGYDKNKIHLSTWTSTSDTKSLDQSGVEFLNEPNILILSLSFCGCGCGCVFVEARSGDYYP